MGGGGGGGGGGPPGPPPPGGGGGGAGMPPEAGGGAAPGGGGGGGGGAPRPDDDGGGGGGGGGRLFMESPRPRGLCATPGEGREGLEVIAGPLSRRALAVEGAGLGALAGADSEELDLSLGSVDANLLPVALSLTLRGLKPNRPAEAGAGLGLGACSTGVRGMVVAFLTPPIGGGGGGGGGGPPKIV